MEEIPVVTCFLRHEGRVLVLRRSEAVGSYRGSWGGVAGHVAESDADPESPDREPIDAAREEIREETAIADATLVRAGDSFAVADADRETRWVVHPFLFDVGDPADDGRPTVEPNDESTEVEWVHAPEIRRRETVPDLWKSYDRVRPRVVTVRDDATHGASSVSLRALEVLRDEAALAAAGEDPGGDDGGKERGGNDRGALAALAREIRDARPSMAVVANRMDRAMHEAGDGRTPAAVESAATDGIDRAVAVDDEAASIAAGELPARVATLSRSGTVRRALRESDPDAVLVAESRPGGEGVGVAESLAGTLPGTDVTLTTDAAFAGELATGDVDAILVGADRILPDGSVVNKVGTRMAATAAAASPSASDCRLLVVASTDKVATDDAVDVEPRDATELYDGEAPVAVANPTFDVTPAALVDALVTERGPLSPAEIGDVAEEHRDRTDW